MQTSYSYAPATAFAGLLADDGVRDVLSRVNPVDAIPFGCAVVLGVDPDNDCKLPAAAADITTAANALGIAFSTQAIESSASGVAQYPVKSSVNVLRKGRVWVQVEEAVTPASPVFVRYASGAGGTQKGAFRASADTATAAQWANARYVTSAGIAGFAQVEIDGI